MSIGARVRCIWSRPPSRRAREMGKREEGGSDSGGKGNASSAQVAFPTLAAGGQKGVGDYGVDVVTCVRGGARRGKGWFQSVATLWLATSCSPTYALSSHPKTHTQKKERKESHAWISQVSGQLFFLSSLPPLKCEPSDSDGAMPCVHRGANDQVNMGRRF